MDASVLKRRAAVAVLGLAFYAVFLSLTAPAAVMAWGLARLTHGDAMLEGPRGGLWSGQAAALVLKMPDGTAHRFSDVQWDARPSRLMAGEAAAQVTLADPRARGTATVALGLRGARLSSAALRISAQSVSDAVPALSLARLGGVLEVRATDWTLTADKPAGSAQIVWHDASTGLSAINPLGSYRAVLKGAGSAMEIEVSTLGGELQVEGRGAWSKARGPAFAGSARSRRPELRSLLQALGQENADGGFRLQLAALPAS